MSHVVVLLAGGRGTRMKSSLPKVLHPVLGRPMLSYGVEAALASGAEEVVVVVGHGADETQAAFRDAGVRFVLQAEQRGTAHALGVVRQALEGFEGSVLVAHGDMPLISSGMLRRLARTHISRPRGMVLTTVELDCPSGYGRVMREDGEILRVVEEKDADLEEKRVQEVNAGVYAFDGGVFDMLSGVNGENVSGELYLTDLVALYKNSGLGVRAILWPVASDLLGVNTKGQLAEVEAIMLDRLRIRWMDAGVRMIQPQTVYLEPGVRLAADVTLWPGVVLRGESRVGPGAVIGPYAVLVDSNIGPEVEVKSHSVLEQARVGRGSEVGPFARLRPGTELSEGVRVGNFVEVKNTRLADGVKAGHLAYLGDAEVGEGANIGAGTITANYDGRTKHRTRIGAGAFIGSNAVLVAPVEIGEEALVGAGSTITQDVPKQALAVARGRQRNLEGYVRRRGKKDS